MTALPALPPKDSTDWYAWAQAVHQLVGGAVQPDVLTSALAGVVTDDAVAGQVDQPQTAARLRAAFARRWRSDPLVIKPRVVASTAPTINDFQGTNAITPNISVSAGNLLSLELVSYCRGGNFIVSPDGYAVSPSYTTPRNSAGRGPFSIQHGFDGTRLAYTIVSAPGCFWRLSVDGQYVNDTAGTAGFGNGGQERIDVTFPDARPRRLRLDLVNADLVEIIRTPTSTLWATPPVGPRCIFIGDSWLAGADADGVTAHGFTGISSLAWSFADALGWENVWQSGVGGTGWINRNSGQTNNYQDRVASDIVAFNPDVVLFMGARNDTGSSTAAVGTAAGQTIAATRAGLPNALIGVFGPNGSGLPVDGTTETFWKPYQDAIFSAVTPYGALTIDTCAPGLMTGSGKAGAATTTGNGDVYMQSDGAHPNQAGSDFLGLALARRFLAALGNP